jgi:glucokinase
LEVSARETIGVDLGGTKLRVGVVGDRAEVLHEDVATSAGLEPGELLSLLEARLRVALEARPGVAAIGLGVPCTIDRARGACIQAVNLPLHDVPLRDEIAGRIGLPVSLDNDANVAVLAEHRCGVARGARNVVMLTIGTGIGGGLIVEGDLFRGSSGAGAELGHMVVDADGPPCQGSCPNRGCIEVFASGTAIARAGAELAAADPGSPLGRMQSAGEPIDGRAVTDAALAGDEAAAEVVAAAGSRLGAALSSLANAFDPDVIVIGGGVAAAGELLIGPAREQLRVRALPPQNETPVEPAGLGPRAGMIGAATLALEELEAG